MNSVDYIHDMNTDHVTLQLPSTAKMADLWQLTRQKFLTILGYIGFSYYSKFIEADRASLAEKFSWSNLRLAPHIGLSFQDANDVQVQYHDCKEQRIALLEKWSQKFGKEATFEKLAKGFEKIERNDIAENICDIFYTRNMTLTAYGK